MLAAMAHRGPNDRGLYADDVATLGHVRLSIIDVSAAGHQPMATADGGIQIVYNGEIYNFEEERAALQAKGYRFSSTSDTEVILALYCEYGEDFLRRLRGMFALALYDKRAGPGREKLLLARDQFGIKPLLYAERDGAIVFASELKGILASALVAREIDTEALQQLLSLGSVYQPRTLIAGVKALPSAHYLVADATGTRLKRYWHYALDRIEGLRAMPYPQQVDAIHAALMESVKLQMVADVPVGAFLSGGVDSSLIVALMARETNGHVKTFSVGFDDKASPFDESHDAAVVAAMLETDHSRVVVGANEMTAHLMNFVRGLDQPSVDGLNSYFVSLAAAQSVTVSLSGTGGDEVFLGYPWFGHIQERFGVEPLNAATTPHLLEGIPWLGPRLKRRLACGDQATAFRETFGRLYHCFGPDMAHQLLAPARREGTQVDNFANALAPCDEMRGAGALDRASVLCLNGYTRNQLLRDIDACSMIHSLEVRVPFLDPVVVDHALSLPTEAKLLMTNKTLDPEASYAESGVKRVVCDVARRYLNDDFFSTRAKRGFGLPHADWLRGPLAEIMNDTLSTDSVHSAGLFDPAMAEAVRREFLVGTRPWSHPWLLMITTLWFQNLTEKTMSESEA